MNINKVSALMWEIVCENQNDLTDIGMELCSLSHKGIGNPIKVDGITMHFHIIFNGRDIEFQSARDLWFFGYGLLASADSLPISFGRDLIKRVIN